MYLQWVWVFFQRKSRADVVSPPSTFFWMLQIGVFCTILPHCRVIFFLTIPPFLPRILPFFAHGAETVISIPLVSAPAPSPFPPSVCPSIQTPQTIGLFGGIHSPPYNYTLNVPVLMITGLSISYRIHTRGIQPLYLGWKSRRVPNQHWGPSTF